MLKIEELHALPSRDNPWKPIKGDIVIIEPTSILPDPEEGGDWQYFSAYIIERGNPFKGWQLGLMDSLRIEIKLISCDIKSNGLIYYFLNSDNKMGLEVTASGGVVTITECNKES